MNTKLCFTLAAIALGTGTTIVVARATTTAPRFVPFDALALTLEINATDVDSGILFFSDTDESLAQLMIQDPYGHVIYEMRSDDPLELGLTEVFWETAEPDIQTALLAYPEGAYTVTAKAFDGTMVHGVANLSHQVPGRPTILAPEDGDRLHVDEVVVRWKLDPNVDHYWLEVESDAQEEFTIQLLPGSDRFRFPASLIAPDSSYKVGVAATGANGNVTMAEVEFDTIP